MHGSAMGFYLPSPPPPPPISFACIFQVSSTKTPKFWGNETMFIDISRVQSHCSVVMFWHFLTGMLSGFCRYGVPLNFCFTVDMLPLWARFKNQEFL